MDPYLEEEACLNSETFKISQLRLLFEGIGYLNSTCLYVVLQIIDSD